MLWTLRTGSGQFGMPPKQLPDALDDEIIGSGLGVDAFLAGLAERGTHAVNKDDVAEGAGHWGPPENWVTVHVDITRK